MPKLTATQAAERWRARSSAAAQDYADGVARVTVSPMQLAIAQKPKMRANLIAAIDEGEWEAGLNRMTLEEWKAIVAAKGQTNYSSGVSAGENKTRDAYTSLFPHIQAGQDMVAGMDSMTLDQNIERSARFIRHMATYRKT